MLRLIMILFFLHSALASVDVLVQRGQISSVDSSGAIAGMSGNAGMWFQLLNSSVHPQALFRYIGSLEKGNLLAVAGNASIAEYFNATGVIPGTGRIETRISMLAFKCLDSHCLSFAPMVLNASSSELYSTWRVLYDSANRSIMVNSIVADISHGNSSKVHGTAGLETGLELLEDRTLPQCNSLADSRFSYSSAAVDNAGMVATLLGGQKMQIFAFRTAIEGVYPGQLGIDGCYKLNLTALSEYGDLIGFNFGNVGDTVMVLGFSISLGGYLQDIAGASLKIILADLAQSVDVNQCSPGSRMLINNIGESRYTVCSAASDTGISRCWLAAVLETNGSCINQSVRAAQMIMQDELNITMMKEPMKQLFRECLQVQGINLPTLPRIVNVSEPDIGSGNAAVCKRNTGMKVDANVLQLLLSGVKNTYVEKHNQLFELDQGPSTDFLTATITILTSFVSVMAAAGPLTGIELAVLRKLGYLEPSLRHLKLTVLTMFNVVLTFFFYLPVLLLARDEMNRQQEYKTWALVSDDFGIVLEGASAGLLVVTGSSAYHSKIIPMVAAFGVLSPILVAAITLNKCLRVEAKRNKQYT